MAIDVAAAGDNTIIAGRSAERIAIYQLVLWAQAAVTVQLLDGGQSINGAGFNFAAQQGTVLDSDLNPLMLGEGAAFTIVLGSAQRVTGWAQYRYER